MANKGGQAAQRNEVHRAQAQPVGRKLAWTGVRCVASHELMALRSAEDSLLLMLPGQWKSTSMPNKHLRDRSALALESVSLQGFGVGVPVAAGVSSTSSSSSPLNSTFDSGIYDASSSMDGAPLAPGVWLSIS